MESPSSSSSQLRVVLPDITDLIKQQIDIEFLDQHLRTKQQLFLESTQFLISSSLTKQCSQLHSFLLNRLTKRTVSWISRSFKANSSFHLLTLSLQNLSLLTSPHGVGSKRFRWVLSEELPRLAKELDRVQSIHSYLGVTLPQDKKQKNLKILTRSDRASTATFFFQIIFSKSIRNLVCLLVDLLKLVSHKRIQQLIHENLYESKDALDHNQTAVQLEALVGDIEDATLFVMAGHTGNMFSSKFSISSISDDNARKHDKLLKAIKAMNDIEEIVVKVVKFHPQWQCLLRSVDVRVDKILAVLRPQVFADHRALLASLGWPPKLLQSENGSEQIRGFPNPLVLMQEDKRKNYSRSFIALCALQHIQDKREERQLNLKKENRNFRLWAIDELVSPIASRVEYHFGKWTEQPEYIFALAYKVTKDFITGVDDILQPLIDKARLISCSAKEAWVYAMVQMLSGFLEKKVFALLAERYNFKHLKPDMVCSWLHLVDLIVAFDKKMQSLVNLDTCFLAESGNFEGPSRGMSVLSIFCDRHDWLKIWAKLEFKNAWTKLNTELKEEKTWVVSNQCKSRIDTDQEHVLSTVEDHKAPPIAELFLKTIWEMIERCQTMPYILSRAQFIRSAAGRFIWYFLKILLLRFKATELSHNSDDVSIVRSCGLINTARYIWIKLQEWSDSVDFLEMKIAENDSCKPIEDDATDNDCFFDEEIRSLSEMETNWLVEIIAVILRQFETLACEYVQNKDNFEEDKGYTNLIVSNDFVEALDALKSCLSIMKLNLNRKDFLDLWRSVAEGLDHYISSCIFRSEIRFSKIGIDQFDADMQALIFIFKLYCARPHAYFPFIVEILKLLKMKKEEAYEIQRLVSNDKSGPKCLHLHGISHLSINQVFQVLRYRN